MIIKKLAAPLVNEKILHEAEYCYIATSAISESGFDFINTRLTKKCKIDIVTGLNGVTSPNVLKRIWRNYQGRITLNIYTKNVFHANVYIFDLPFRKSVAFVGTGSFTLEGLKDHEEIFHKTTDAKEIEALKSWFTGYYEFAEPLNEALIQEYDFIYPSLKQREIKSQQDKRHIIELTTGSFNWDAIKWKNQYFKKEDYLTFANTKAPYNTPELEAERNGVKAKLLQLHASIKKHIGSLKLHADDNEDNVVSSIRNEDHEDRNVKSLWLAYGRSKAALNAYSPSARITDFLTMQVILRQKDVCVCIAGRQNSAKEDREYFKDKMQDEAYRTAFLTLLRSLGVGYCIEVVGDKRPVESFLNAEALVDYTKYDDWKYFNFSIGKTYQPHETEISADKIGETICKEFDKLILVYDYMIDKREK